MFRSMECRATSTKNRRCAAASLVEVLISSALLLIAMTTMAALYVYFLKAFAGMENHMNMNNLSRYALDRMSKEIRQSDGLTYYATNKITLTNKASRASY